MFGCWVKGRVKQHFYTKFLWFRARTQSEHLIAWRNPQQARSGGPQEIQEATGRFMSDLMLLSKNILLPNSRKFKGNSSTLKCKPTGG